MGLSKKEKVVYAVGTWVIVPNNKGVYEVLLTQPLSKTKIPCLYKSKDGSVGSCKSYPQRSKMLSSPNYGDLNILKLRRLGTDVEELVQNVLCEPYMDKETIDLVSILDKDAPKWWKDSIEWIEEDVKAEKAKNGLVHTGKS